MTTSKYVVQGYHFGGLIAAAVSAGVTMQIRMAGLSTENHSGNARCSSLRWIVA